ncbi:chemotaxis protein CheW [Derxia gummosa]|uniref:Chemotaxis protein CheA n=1 Tax=Derxia gummosa DSM 723 TaxID=1121388 RepID=A0A8B6X0X7_9BURK|nr:chemotaxis protein CheW [Derxia gummosa]
MGDMSQSSGLGGGFDLSQFYSVFFEEAGENLANFEGMLLNVDCAAPDDEDLNAIFRAAHSIKGGSATFGFSDVTELTHELETLLDRVRKHELSLDSIMVDTLLEAGDVLKSQLARHQAGGSGALIDDADLKRRLRLLASGEKLSADDLPAPAPAGPSLRSVELVAGPLKDVSVADNLMEPFAEIPQLGTISKVDFAPGTSPGEGYVRFRVDTLSPDEELLDLCNFYLSREQLKFGPWSDDGAAPAAAPAPAALADIPGFGLFDDEPAPAAPAQPPVTIAPPVVAAPAVVPEPVAAPRAPSVTDTQPVTTKPRERAAAPAAGLDSQTLRVSVEKVDQLINLVGELVITQAMLSQKVRDLDPVQHQNVLGGVSDLERNTRHLQDAVMSIRMIPMAFVFNRFPRMIRDLAAKLGKKVELVTSGEATELDKGLIEKIVDPLTHLVRNSVDHGLEMPEARKLAGKPETGVVTLSAFHQGGSIVIEVRDDGQGLRRDKILAKAAERGLPVHDAMTDQEVWQLIFAPGFSTADQITDVSGRGVGMDVVKKNIAALNGSVELDSTPGKGSRVIVRLPLTLAIMDGMSVAAGGEIYIFPLASVVESLQLSQDQIKSIASSGRVVDVRNEYLPVVSLRELFEIPDDGAPPESIMVVIESDGVRTAVLVDELVGQHQVVVKNLEANYRKVRGVSGATILGDGRVALILDVTALAKQARH